MSSLLWEWSYVEKDEEIAIESGELDLINTRDNYVMEGCNTASTLEKRNDSWEVHSGDHIDAVSEPLSKFMNAVEEEKFVVNQSSLWKALEE